MFLEVVPSDIAGPAPFPGKPFPLGATVSPEGTSFSLVADRATAVELCLIGAGGSERRLTLPERTAGVWHGFVPGVGPGQRYGYRIHGADPAKLLLDPYARQVDTVEYDLAVVSTPGVDSAGFAPLGVVSAPPPRPRPGPGVRWEQTVFYEAHVKGLTHLHPEIPRELRGTYAGMAHPVIIDHLRSLGVTAVELLPVHAGATEPGLAATGRANYWGYSTLSYFAVHPGYAVEPGEELIEFARLVDTLHEAGIEVIMDVVYNHTCEGGIEIPIWLAQRGLDRDNYYLADGHDITGTGNTVQCGSLATVRLVCDSLRYFADELQIDGFRFDLASVLGRPNGGPFDPNAPLLAAIAADPLLSSRKLIAEPWDATGEGYAVGRFGPNWAEWNDRFRDTVRDFWRGVGGVRDLGYRLSGSSDLYGALRRPWASVNFITAHDGFTLRDAVTYSHKHNAANGEEGRDGTDNNRSANYGTEGETNDPAIRAMRTRQARNLAATLLLATGTPLITQGDEMWRTQQGNNNAYCQDNEISWVGWELSDEAADMLAFFRRTLAIRAQAPALHQGEFFEGRAPGSADRAPDLMWFNTDGEPMSMADWFDSYRSTMQMWVNGRDVRGRGAHDSPQSDSSWLMVLHSGWDSADITLPGSPYGSAYTPVIDTDTPTGTPADDSPIGGGVELNIKGRTFWLLRAHRGTDPNGGD